MKTFDIAFIGLGAAAMSLASRLAQGHWSGSAVFIEPADTQRNDRTWCGWGPSDHPFQDQLTRTWTQWAVSHADTSIIRHSAQTPYQMLTAGALRERSKALIDQRDDWQCLSARALKNADRTANGWQLHLDDQSSVHAHWVMDARAPTLNLKRPWLWQSFIGVEVKAKGFSDNDTVRLMDFMDDDTPLVSFIYELPINAEQRLIEFTRFTPERADENRLREALQAHLSARGISPEQILREESGHLPMAPIKPYCQAQWMRIGTAGGSMRPATGYAFHNIQRWSNACANALLAGNTPIPPRRSGLMDWLDGIFLESLWQSNHPPAKTFMRLFERTPASALCRFLMSQARFSDVCRVLLALPKRTMIKAAFRYHQHNDS